MNKYISDFLDMVCGEIKYKKIHRAISSELKCHISELMDEYIENGMNEEEAAKKAVEQMGDPIEIGKDLNKTHRPKTEWSIIALIGAIVLIGGITLFSIASDEASIINFNQFVRSYLLYVLIGVGIFIACYFFDYTKIENYSLYIFLATIVSFFMITKFGVTVHGRHYIGIGGLFISPVSIAFPLLLVSFSGVAKKLATGSIKSMLKLLGLAVLPLIMMIIYPSIASALLLAFGFLIIITIIIMSKEFKGNRKEFLISIYGGGVLISLSSLLFIILRGSYRAQRLLVFLNPNSDPNGSGYINLLLKKMLSSAKLVGKSDSLYFVHQGANQIALPQANTDFIFTYIVSAFGWLVGIITIFIITLAIVRMFLSTRKINHLYGKHLAGSIVSIFALQAFEHILMNIGLLPLMDSSLPFISYGGTNFVINMALIGLLLGIYRRKDLVDTGTGQMSTLE